MKQDSTQSISISGVIRGFVIMTQFHIAVQNLKGTSALHRMPPPPSALHPHLTPLGSYLNCKQNTL